jgi:hypothetical protein
MEDDAHCVPDSRPEAADSMPEIDSIYSARTLNRSMMNRECHGITLMKCHYFWPRLHARPLFRQNELSSREVSSWL